MDSLNYQYEVLRTFAITHNYNRWIFDLLKPSLGKNILEVGCGIGNLTKYLANYNRLTCIDKSENFIKHMKIDYPEIKFYEVDITDRSVLKLGENSFDTVICVNVLEHIDDDIKALKNMFDLLEKNGKLLLIVPAIENAYGTMDKKVGHFRRYSKYDIVKKLSGVNFTIEKIQYHNIFGLIGWLLNARIFKRSEFPIFQTIFYDKLIPFISKLEKNVKLPIGMNLFVIAVKP